MSFRFVRLMIVFMLWSCLSFCAAAQEVEQLPLPKAAPQPSPAIPAPFEPPLFTPLPARQMFSEPPPRIDSRAGWAYFAPNQYGQMRPRVVLSPGQSYYLYSGEPYGLTTVHPRYFLPKTSFPASFGK